VWRPGPRGRGDDDRDLKRRSVRRPARGSHAHRRLLKGARPWKPWRTRRPSSPELCRKLTYSGFVRTLSEECPRVLLRIEIPQTAIPEAKRAPFPERIELAVRRTVNFINERLVVHFVFPHLWVEVDYPGNVEVPLPVPFSAVSLD
jgi:hypothetical protein